MSLPALANDPAAQQNDQALDKRLGWLEDVTGTVTGTAAVIPVSVAATTWTLNHNLGFKPGGVLLLDNTGEEIRGAISHPSVNQTVVSFSAAVSGSALLS